MADETTFVRPEGHVSLYEVADLLRLGPLVVESYARRGVRGFPKPVRVASTTGNVWRSYFPETAVRAWAAEHA